MNRITNGPPMAPSFPFSRTLSWSIRRELWESRSVWMAPLAVTAVVLLASLISLAGLPDRLRNVSELEPARRHFAVWKSFAMAPAPIMLASFLTGVFYAIDALYGERRDRSLLFWKSMPVSDLVTVLSKASVPVLVLPAIALGLSVATLHVLVLVATLVLIGSGVGAGALWSNLRFVQEQAIMVYGLAVHSLWFAPLYAWLLLVSAWARRAPLAWAVLPFVAIGAFERIALGSSGVGALLQYRVTGAMTEAFTADFGHEVVTPISQLTPLRFLSAPGLWLGLLFAGACLAAAVRLRRNREPA